jgi:hypothetical protein
MLAEERLELVGQVGEAFGKRRGGVCLELAVGEVGEAIAFRAD